MNHVKRRNSKSGTSATDEMETATTSAVALHLSFMSPFSTSVTLAGMSSNPRSSTFRQIASMQRVRGKTMLSRMTKTNGKSLRTH